MMPRRSTSPLHHSASHSNNLHPGYVTPNMGRRHSSAVVSASPQLDVNRQISQRRVSLPDWALRGDCSPAAGNNSSQCRYSSSRSPKIAVSAGTLPPVPPKQQSVQVLALPSPQKQQSVQVLSLPSLQKQQLVQVLSLPSPQNKKTAVSAGTLPSVPPKQQSEQVLSLPSHQNSSQCRYSPCLPSETTVSAGTPHAFPPQQ